MPTRKELHAFQRQEITLLLSNGAKVHVPAMKAIMAILNVLTPDQKSRALNIILDDSNSQLVSGASITIPDLQGVSHGRTTF